MNGSSVRKVDHDDAEFEPSMQISVLQPEPARTDQREAYRAPLSDEQMERLGRVLDDLLGEAEAASTPDIDAACQKHPDLASAIRHYILSIQLLHQAAEKGELTDSPLLPLDLGAAASRLHELGDYRLLREIGRGGMGVVYEAKQISLARRVAVKVLPFAAVLDARQIKRFQIEAQAAASLNHPNIVPVYAVGNDRGTYFYSMQFIDGQSLDHAIDQLRSGRSASIDARGGTSAANVERCANGGSNGIDQAGMSQYDSSASQVKHSADTLRVVADASTVHSVCNLDYVRRIVELGVQAAEALHYAHQHGIVHRDIKPSNLMLDTNGKLWITDFGLAQCSARASSLSENQAALTRPGDLVGTLRYMSPEQVSSNAHLVDHRTDLYSLGATLYELLTLRSVVEAQDRAEVIKQLETDSSRPPRKLNSAVPIALENIILKSLSRQREDRYASAEELANDLRRFLTGQKPIAKRSTLFERTARFIRRKPKLIVVSAIVLLAICACSLIATSILNLKNQQIMSAYQLAQRHLQTANEAVYRFGPEKIKRLELLPGSDDLRREMAEDALAYFKDFASQVHENHAMHTDVVEALMICGDLQLQLGRNSEALASFQQAGELLQSQIKQSSSEARVLKLLLCTNNQFVACARLGDLQVAKRGLEAALKSPQLTSVTQAKHQISACEMLLHLNLGTLYCELGELHSAKWEFDRVFALSKNQHSVDAEGLDAIPGAEISTLLTAALQEAGELPNIDPAYSRTLLELALRNAESYRDSNFTKHGDVFCKATAEHDLSLCRLALGAHLLQLGEAETSRVYFEKAVGDLRRLHLTHPAVTKFALDLSTALNNLGQSEMQTQALNAAEQAFEESREYLERLLQNTNEYVVQSCLGGVCNNLALVKEARGLHDEAEKLLKEAIVYQKKAIAQSPDSKSCESFLAEHIAQLARLQSLQTEANLIEVN